MNRVLKRMSGDKEGGRGVQRNSEFVHVIKSYYGHVACTTDETHK